MLTLTAQAAVHRKRDWQCHQDGTMLKNRRQISANRFGSESRLRTGLSPSCLVTLTSTRTHEDAMAKKAKKAKKATKKAAKKTVKKAKKAKKK